MKTARNLLSLLVAAGTAGVALLALNNLIPADVAFAIFSVGALVGFAAYDYTRTTKSLRVPGRVLRPTLPVATVASAACNVRRAA
ncbi:MAG: hypothetical protein WDM96_01550 [Lacunisphaera sp.]